MHSRCTAHGFVAALVLVFCLSGSGIAQGQEAESRQAEAQKFFELGNQYYSIDKLDDAIAAFQKALQLKPNYAAARHNLGLTLRKAGREEEARREFAEAERLDPTLKPPQ